MDDVDALFLLPPEEFVAARDELAASLRTAGEKDRAKAVKALRRPTLAAWAVNAAVRRAPEQLDELLDLRTALVKAQRQVLSGVKADLAGLTRQRRELVERMVTQAEAALSDAGRDLGPHREEVRLSFEAAVADEEAAAAVQAGRLSKALPAPAGFGTLAGLTAVPDQALHATPEASAGGVASDRESAGTDAGSAGEGAAAPQAAESRAAEGRAAEGRAAESEAEQAEARLRDARALRDRVADAAEKALAHAREVERDASRLRDDADDAESTAARRAREAEAARVRAAQAESAATAAREAADTADGRARRARHRAEEIQQQLQEADNMIESMLD